MYDYRPIVCDGVMDCLIGLASLQLQYLLCIYAYILFMSYF